jgi:hypothetical protein
VQDVGANMLPPCARVDPLCCRYRRDHPRPRWHVIAGSLHDAVEARDVWTFRRDINSADPDWLLEETDEG